MSKIRIVCKAPARPPPTVGYPMINGVVATSQDARVYMVDDRGGEHEILCRSVSFTIDGTSNEPVTATLVFYPDEVDVEAQADV